MRADKRGVPGVERTPLSGGSAPVYCGRRNNLPIEHDDDGVCPNRAAFIDAILIRYHKSDDTETKSPSPILESNPEIAG